MFRPAAGMQPACRPFPPRDHERHGKTSFSPKQTVSWAQAVAIAVRIHAACNDGEIAETGGAWYEPYIAYATEAKLLPSTCPDGSAVTAKTITRQELAGLFANVLRAEDLPAINDQTIPDLNAVDAEFREAVRENVRRGRLHRQKRREF